MTSQIQLIFCLLVIFHIKHFIADFPLQREYMLRKSLPGWGFFLPLSIHAGIHALFTLLVVLYFTPSLWWIGILDFVIHFITDRLKSGPQFLGRYSDLSKPIYWNVFGLDQTVHHLTHVWFIYIMVTVA